MNDFHILHYVPNDYLHVLNGYQEIIDALAWSLRTLGHRVTIAKNKFRSDATQIIFGAHFIHVDVLATFPRDTIIYNLEQLDGVIACGAHIDAYQLFAQNFVVWEYSERHLGLWRSYFSAQRVSVVPIGFAPNLCRIQPAETQDIDVLFYGQPSDYRAQILLGISRVGLRMLSCYGIYGKARDEFIGRSKIVLNLRASPNVSTFSSVRVGYLLANRKAIVSDIATSDAELAEAVCVGEAEDIPALCRHLADNDPQRLWYEVRGYEAFAQNDMVPALQSALSALLAPYP